MKKLDAVLVVEGKMDRDLISSFIDCDIVTTNGSAVSRETIELVRGLKKKGRVIVFTDPDAPGKRIRDILNNEIEGLENAFVPKEKAIKGRKVGVAECSKETILEALEHSFANLPSPTSTSSSLAFADLYDLGLAGGADSSFRRKKLQNRFHLGECNAKTFLKRCNMLGLGKKDLEEAIND